MSLLEVAGASVHYGRVKAVDGVSCSVASGAIIGIIGPNGAGKTSLIDALSGFVPLTSGTVRLNGRDISRQPPYMRTRLGMARTWQSGELFEDLTVYQNVAVAADSPRWWTMARDMIHPRRRVSNEAGVNAALAALGLADCADRIVSEIPHDKRQLVSIARALAGGPSVVLLDEPAAGLNPGETAALGRQLQRAAANGLGIVLIDHDMDLVLSVCEVVVVLDFGRQIAAGPPEQIVANQLVIDAYLGGEAATGHESSNGVPAR